MNKQTMLIGGGTLITSILLIGAFVFLNSPKPSNLDGLAKCLKEKKVTFYGAFWCPHCQNQKKMFGDAERFLPYVECSTADGNGQLDVCKKKNVQTYPTWEFADGSRLTGEVKPEDLAKKASCQMPK